MASPVFVASARLPDAVSRMSPRLRRNSGGSRGTLRTLIYLATYCAFERIVESASVVALLAISPLENSSPVHPASFLPRFGSVPEHSPPNARVYGFARRLH